MKKLIVSAMLLSAIYADAEETQRSTWITASAVSYHLDRSIKARDNMNERNAGLGIEHSISDKYDLRAVSGAYNNSFRRDTVYIGALYLPVSYGPFKAGLQAGLATGYQHAVIPYAAGVLSVEYKRVGLNLIYLPKADPKTTAVIGLQVKFRID